VLVGFGGLRDLNDGRFWWVTRTQNVLFRYEFSMTFGFVPFKIGYKILMASVLFGHEISRMACFVPL